MQTAAMAAQGRGDAATALQCMLRCAELIPGDEAAAYNLACVYAVMGQPDTALSWLEKSAEWGFDQVRLARCLWRWKVDLVWADSVRIATSLGSVAVESKMGQCVGADGVVCEWLWSPGHSQRL